MSVSRVTSLLRKPLANPVNSFLGRHYSNLPPNPEPVSLIVRENLNDQIRQQQETEIQLSRDVGNICKILSTNNSNPQISTLLDRIQVEPSEDLVAEVLKKLSNSASLAVSFFTWAERRPGFKHTAESYNALIEALGKIKQFNKIWHLVDEMNTEGLLTKETFVIIARRYAKAKKPYDAIKAFEKMEEILGSKLDLSDFNCMLDTLCKSKFVAIAQKVFDKKRGRSFKPDLKTYTILLEGWGQNLNLMMVDEVCREMKDDGFGLDVVGCGILINAHCKARKFDKALEIFHVMRAKGCKPSPHIFCTLIIGLGSVGRLEEALEFFRLSKESGFPPETPTYNAVVGAYCWSGRTRDALSVVEEMRELGIGPNYRTYDILIQRLVKGGKAEAAFQVFERMSREGGCEPTVSTYEIMVRMFCNEGDMEMAIRVWDWMRAKGVIPGMHMFLTLISRLFSYRKFDEGCKYFEELLRTGIRPPARLYSHVKRALVDNGRHDLLQALNDMIDKYRKTGFHVE